MFEPRKLCSSKMKYLVDMAGSACRNCRNEWVCCTELEPPELTKVDIQSIKAFYPTQCNLVFENHPYYPNGPLRILRQSASSSCPFFDASNGTCNIYSHRPLLCRLFPLDIYCDSGEYFWIIYHKFCALSDLILEKFLPIALDQAERQVLPHFSREELLFYSVKAVREFSLFKKGEWRKLRKVKYPSDTFGG